jgi:hypothetical protein
MQRTRNETAGESYQVVATQLGIHQPNSRNNSPATQDRVGSTTWTGTTQQWTHTKR